MHYVVLCRSSWTAYSQSWKKNFVYKFGQKTVIKNFFCANGLLESCQTYSHTTHYAVITQKATFLRYTRQISHSCHKLEGWETNFTGVSIHVIVSHAQLATARQRPEHMEAIGIRSYLNESFYFRHVRTRVALLGVIECPTCILHDWTYTCLCLDLRYLATSLVVLRVTWSLMMHEYIIKREDSSQDLGLHLSCRLASFCLTNSFKDTTICVLSSLSFCLCFHHG